MKGLFVGIGIFLLVLVIAYGMAGFDLAVWQPWAANKQTDVTRNTNQYVTTQVQLLTQFATQYDSLNVKIAEAKATKAAGITVPATLIESYEAQRRAIVNQMRQVASTLPANRVPPNISLFLNTQ